MVLTADKVRYKMLTLWCVPYHLHTRDKQNNYKYFTKLEMRLWLNNLIYVSVRDTLNYQNNCRNTFGWLMGLRYKAKSNYFTCV